MITIICGDPGAGKTALLTYFAITEMLENGYNQYRNLKKEIDILKPGGFENVELPPQKHLVYADYSIKFRKNLTSYTCDGYKIGLSNIYYETTFFPTGSTIFLDEAQRYYNSRFSKYLRPQTYNWYQMHRHNDYNIFMVCQRLENIDVNIRAIAERILVIDKMIVSNDKYGRVTHVNWKVHQFNSPDVAESYYMARDKHQKSELGEVVEFNTDLPIFYFYDNKGCKPIFYYKNYYKGFDYYVDLGYNLTAIGVEEYNDTHIFTIPEGYLINADYDKKCERRYVA